MKDSVGYELSGCNAQAIDLLERGFGELRCYATDPLASADAAIAAAPECVMAHVLRAWLNVLGTEAPGWAVAREAHATAAALPHTEREAAHLRAIALWTAGQWHAAGRALEDLSIAFPRDVLALQAGHQLDFFTGDARMLRDRIARAMPAWSAGTPGWHAVLGMQAFGLEESGDDVPAERLGRQAIELEPRDAWAQHAVAHVMEMQGRTEEGVRWMKGNAGWQRDNFLAVHNWWHLALYHLERGEIDAVFELLDGPIDGAGSVVVMELIDAAALLWRLMLRGVNVGMRWASVADRFAPAAGSANYAFNDLHAAMAFACAGRDELLHELLDAQARAMRADDDNAAFTRDVGAPATQAVIAFAAGDFTRCVDLLRPIRNHAHRFGGSHAQRDVIDQTLIAAAERSGQALLVAALEAERAAAKRRRGKPLTP